MLYRSLLLSLFLISLLGVLSAGPVPAGEDDKRYIYQWIDDRGNVSITDNLQNVPQQYRSRATRTEQRVEGEKGKGGQEIREEASRDAGSDLGTAAEEDELRKAEWQQRMSDAKRRLAAAERRLGDLEQRKRVLTNQWGAAGSALPPQEVMDELARIEVDMVRARQEMDKANEAVNVTIPDQARKAGIPPGWLREVQ